MNIIKFRGIHKGEFVYGCYVTDYKNYHAIATDSMNNDEMLNQHVNAETVGQFTGLKDKNGVCIYKGDIVEKQGRFSKCNSLVEWNPFKNMAGFQVKNPRIDLFDSRSITVIGNIHESPDLLNTTNIL